MSATQPHEAHEFLAREYGRLREDVLHAVRARLAAHRIELDDADLDAAYNQAWHALYDRLAAGEDIDNPAGFLVTVAHRRAIDEVRRLHPDMLADADRLPELGVEQDIAEQLDQAATVRRLVEGMKERLDERECKAASLCLLHGFTRREAADLLGESPKRMEKVMDAVHRKLAVLAADIRGDWCRNRRSLMKAYALGLLAEGGARRAAAAEHLRECAACRSYVNEVRGLSAVLPPVALPLADGATLERLNGMAAAAWRHGGELLGPAAGHVVELGAATAGGAAALLHGAGAGAGGAGSSGGHGGGLGALGVKVGVAAGGVAAAAAATLAVTGVFGGQDPPPPRTTPSVPAAVPAAATQAARPPARTTARKPAKRAKRPERRAKRRAATTAATPAPAPAPASTPAPAPAPASTPAPAPAPTPAPAPERPIVTDAAQEFDP